MARTTSSAPTGRTRELTYSPRPQRVRIVAVLLVLAFVGVGLKAARLSLVFGDDLRHLAEQQYLRDTTLSAPRGEIRDRAGVLLAASAPSFSIAVRPKAIEDPIGVAQALASALNQPASAVQKKLAGSAPYVWLSRRVEREAAEAVRALGLPGVDIRQEARRFYPQRSLMGQAFGGVDIDGNPRAGVEKAFDVFLRGRGIKTPSILDNRGQRLAMEADVDVVGLFGDTVALTIDAGLQQVAEEALADAVRTFDAKAAWAIVLDAKSAEVLAMANVPLFNPNAPQDSASAQKNRAVGEAFEPGSIFKIATFAAAIDAGVITPDERLFCENGAMELGKHTIHDTHKAGWLTATEVFKHSSNIGTLKIAQRLGEDAFKEALERYGFSSRTGLQLHEEATSRFPKERWGEARLATASFGHGVITTAMQMLSFTQAVANDGVRVSPHLLMRVTSHQGELVEEGQAGGGERLMTARTARVLTEIMQTVTEKGGTAELAAIPGISVAGKTGTAEKVDPVTKRYSSDLHVSSFVGFAPADAPEIVTIVVVDEPHGNAFGGTVAAPAWKRITMHARQRRGITLGAQPVAAHVDNGAAEEGALMSQAAKTAPVTIVAGVAPDVRGHAVREALHAAAALGVRLRAEGSGVVVSQSPAPGKALSGELVVRLADASLVGEP